MAAGALIAAGVAAAVVIWLTANRIRGLEAELAAANRKTADIEREVREYGRVSRTTAQAAADARDEAARAAEAAARQTTARELAEAARQQAESEAQRARQVEARSQEELAAIRRRRNEEMDRMQEALSRIAPTRRTASGMIVELANDSFHFDFDKADLRPQNREILSRIAGVLLASEGYRVFVYGHTDDTGSEEYNQGLSERRARSVADYLADAGLPRELLQVKGFGKTNPRVENSTPAGRQKNRRVEIGIVDSIIEYQGLATGSKPAER